VKHKPLVVAISPALFENKKMCLKVLRKNEHGMSLIEVLIAVGISSIISFVMASVMVNVSTDQRALQEKYSLLELKNDLLVAFSNTDICLAQLNQNSPRLRLSGVTVTSPSSQVIDYKELRLGTSNRSQILAKVGEPLPGNGPRQMVVSKIEFGSFLATGTPNTYTGELKIELDSKSLTRPLKSLSLTQVFNTTGPLGAAKIAGCGIGDGNNFTGGQRVLGTFDYSYSAKNTKSYPIMITANGGKANLGPNDSNGNPCSLKGMVNNALITQQTDNNTKFAKYCTISFWVSPGANYTVLSDPYPINRGRFNIVETD
jgi:prepilin-type N-terminal cleavage/methylation domain-containing protein